MQFATPWQFAANGIPQVWTANGLQSQALLAPNPIFIRGTQPDGTPGMFIQQSPQPTTIQTQQNGTPNHFSLFDGCPLTQLLVSL